MWPLYLNRVVGAPDDLFVIEEKSIFEDKDGHYVYQISNAKFGDPFPPVLEVKRQPVTVKKLQFPFLGIWNFLEVQFEDGSDIGIESLVAGEMAFSGESAEQWNGKEVVLDTGAQWALRPGDLVDVNLSADTDQCAGHSDL